MVQCPVTTALKQAERSCGSVSGSCQVAQGNSDVKDHWKSCGPNVSSWWSRVQTVFNRPLTAPFGRSLTEPVFSLGRSPPLVSVGTRFLLLNYSGVPYVLSWWFCTSWHGPQFLPDWVCLGKSAPNCPSQKKTKKQHRRRVDSILITIVHDIFFLRRLPLCCNCAWTWWTINIKQAK